MILVTSSCFQNVLRPANHEKPAFLNSSGLKSVLEKVPFRLQISVDGGEKIQILFSSGILLWPLEHKIHIFELTCNDDGVFGDFLKISDHFPTILQNLSEGHTNVAGHFPNISEDC